MSRAHDQASVSCVGAWTGVLEVDLEATLAGLRNAVVTASGVHTENK